MNDLCMKLDLKYGDVVSNLSIDWRISKIASNDFYGYEIFFNY